MTTLPSTFMEPETGRDDDGFTTHSMLLNIGPSHPAMHGVVRIITRLDGETIVDSDIEIGYLHRCFEKDCEAVGWAQCFPYTDRLNYVSPLINNVGYAMAVEKLFDLQTTERCQYIRVIICELSRLTDHLTAIAASAMELGAMTAFLYYMKAREWLYQFIEELTGARLTVSYVHVGGVKGDLPEGWTDRLLPKLDEIVKVIGEVDALLTRNRIFFDRMKDIGCISSEEALSLGFTGPCLRSTGVPWDIRKDEPYLIYDRLDFDVPVGEVGDNYDRYLVRTEEMLQSIRMLRQAIEQMPPGAVMVTLEGRELTAAEMVDAAKMGMTSDLLLAIVRPDPTLDGAQKINHVNVRSRNKCVDLPAKEDTYGNIEGLMNHFMRIMENEGMKPPPGESYQGIEGANGELGFYAVSNGTGRAWRMRCRGPCFYLMQGLSPMIKGGMIADIIPTFGSINMIAGEMDR